MSLTSIRHAVRDLLREKLPDADVQVAAGKAEYTNDPLRYLLVQIVLGPNSDATQDTLDQLLEEDGEQSVRTILDSETLDGLVSDLRVASTTGYRTYQTPNGPLLGAEWSLTYLT